MVFASIFGFQSGNACIKPLSGNMSWKRMIQDALYAIFNMSSYWKLPISFQILKRVANQSFPTDYPYAKSIMPLLTAI